MNTTTNFFEDYVFYYSVTLFLLYAVLGFAAFIAIRKYKMRIRKEDKLILSDPTNAPFVSVIAPAFNEEKTIIVNVKSLLTLNYPNFEVIIVNDGSKDRSLDLLINEFELVETNYLYIEKVKTRSFKSIYRSENPKFSKLTVVNKKNTGAKADALNAGINVSQYDHILCVDVDCILERDVLAKMVKPMMNSDVRVIGIGAALRISNNCDVDTKRGLITEVKPPNCLLALFQELEYMRSFLLSKMGWSLVNAVPNVSGALGLYDKEIVIKSGGYDSGTIAEDMDLVIRIASYMIEQGEKYRIKYLPISGSWTEGPPNLKLLGRQRSRWASGLAQVLVNHRMKLFNPKYKKIGMVVLPNNLLFEVLAPIIEVIGIVYFVYLLFFGIINWNLILLTLLLSYSIGLVLSSLVILFDILIQIQYKKKRFTLRLLFLPFLEPILYHPVIVYYSLKGFYKFLSSRKIEWGVMTRIGYEENSEIILTEN
ncbi:MAG: glycosyltransferase family 2 protein [Moheibacter sp.]